MQDVDYLSGILNFMTLVFTTNSWEGLFRLLGILRLEIFRKIIIGYMVTRKRSV